MPIITSVTISGPKAGGGTGTTDALGEVIFTITNAPSGTYTTTVTDVTATGRSGMAQPRRTALRSRRIVRQDFFLP